MTVRVFQTPACPHCHKTSEVGLDFKDVERWQGGELIQRVWPEMTPAERELLMTGTHPDCWNEMFSGAAKDAVSFLQDIFKED